MKNSIILGALIAALMLAPLAAAGSQNYNANVVGLPAAFSISGTLSGAEPVPTLHETKGTAVIVSAVYNPLTSMWSGTIKCVLPASEVDLSCAGTVSAT